MERKEANFERWKKFGKGLCGVDEAVIRGGRKVDGEEEEGLEKGLEEVKLEDEKKEKTELSTSTNENSSSEGTVSTAATTTTGIEKATTPGLDDKFVDAPIAPKDAVEQAVPALTA